MVKRERFPGLQSGRRDGGCVETAALVASTTGCQDDAALSTVSEISQNLQIIGVTNVASSQAMIAIPLPMER